jgi:hypothetical protein
MTLIESTRPASNGPVVDNAGDLVWGAEAIGLVINRTERQTHHLLSTGAIKCARKVGGRYVAGRSALLREFGGLS